MQVAPPTSVNLSMSGYPNNMMATNPAPAMPWQYKIPKEEPMDDRDDSGINSGISSPASDSSQDLMNPYSPQSGPAANAMNGQYSPPLCLPDGSAQFHTRTSAPMDTMYQMPAARPPYYSTPVPAKSTYPTNLLTPPISEPSRDIKEESEPEGDVNEDALRHLQRAFGQNSFHSAEAPKSGDESKSDEDSKLKTPTKSSNKRKLVKCRHCSETFTCKEDMWEHYRVHIKSEKLLACPHCPFVTEYKHHYEYHIRNHDGSKPYKCEECSYECVSKSMLNSHMKSHSSVYQYHCRDCNYVAKYCHSLKQHLRKYSHRPGAVLNPDGTPNPFPVIDVYGTRRGPKVKKIMGPKNEEPEPNQQVPPQMPLMNQLMMNPTQLGNFPLLPQIQQMQQFFHPLLGALSQQMMLQNLERLARERNLSNSTDEPEQDATMAVPKMEEQQQQEERQQQDAGSETDESGALDLSKTKSGTSRRKGPAFKLSPHRNDTSDEDDEQLTTMFSNVEVVQNREEEPEKPVKESEKENTECQYCDIDFRDPLLYSLHMRFHSGPDPFTCSMCGEHHPDKLRFFLHITHKPH
ncbi:protein hunchback isoform X2 [Aethina tumida]|nr:protein hunchback isoform X2 [Aethina tumida]